MYANEMTSLLELSRTEHKAVADLATAVLSLVVKLKEEAEREPVAVIAMRKTTATAPGARRILERIAARQGLRA